MSLRHITKILDVNKNALNEILTSAQNFKKKHQAGIRKESILDGRVVALVFEKPSLRTKITFEVAAAHLDGHAVFLSSDQIFASGGNQYGRESVPDICRNLERFCDLIIARVFSHKTIETLASISRVPVINALCDQHHPCQAIADLMAIELRASKSDKRFHLTYIGDGNNVANSLIQACALRGYDVTVASPKGYEISQAEQGIAKRLRLSESQKLVFTNDPFSAVKGADIIYTDTYVSMGQEDSRIARLNDFKDFQVNGALMDLAPSHAVFMHCLPAHRGEEVTDEVMDSERSIVFEQAECRLYVAKAVLKWCLAL